MTPAVFRIFEKHFKFDRAGLIDRSFAVGDGWAEIIWDMLEGIEKLMVSGTPSENFRIHQVKEKFADLRVYHSGATPEIHAVVEAAVALASKTCESCGSEGTEVGVGGWISVLCPTCLLVKERQMKRERTEP